VLNEEAEDLAARCPMGVFDIEDLGKKGGGRQAAVARPRDCTMCRECVREGPAKEKVKLRRVADHFIFSIESVGALPPERILKDVSVCLCPPPPIQPEGRNEGEVCVWTVCGQGYVCRGYPLLFARYGFTPLSPHPPFSASEQP
jgi:NAD-dependent dihydropyrimidine dehydrogenase PreA subunit